ncbi:hypothetical protein [Rickettsiella massiliensis]|uniref:hypothetical protein n=1 Tax=Rickettsiella massiliensis TaxID=676517 RepID=UPI00029A33F3|nr:hypothetical protein [Rickettsiella massiliensis]
MKTEVKEPSYSKLNQEEASNVVTKEPNRTVSMDKIEVLSSEIVNLPLVENRYANCFSRFNNWMCFWSSPLADKFVHPSEVYQPTTTSIK